MFPFWLDLSSDILEPLAVVLITLVTWFFQTICPRGGA
jgi:hypothetical protein